MLIEDVIGNRSTDSTPKLYTISSACSQFLMDSVGCPLYRALPTSYSTFHKVKVRAKKSTSLVGQAFNKAFEDNYLNIAQRAVFTHPTPRAIAENTEPFYVFPINGFKFLYSKEVQNSSSDYAHVIDTIFEEFKDGSIATDIASDLLKFTYVGTNLFEGIASDAEVVVYGIPYYYAIRASAYPDYRRLLSRIQQQ